jgi:hypothetical protein
MLGNNRVILTVLLLQASTMQLTECCMCGNINVPQHWLQSPAGSCSFTEHDHKPQQEAIMHCN